jgi:hypothetical protein
LVLFAVGVARCPCNRRRDCVRRLGAVPDCPRITWVVAVAWVGVGCFLNGRSCGRVHRRIDGVAFPTLALVGVLNVLSIITFDWNLFWLAFIVILVGSFIPEWTWKKCS